MEQIALGSPRSVACQHNTHVLASQEDLRNKIQETVMAIQGLFICPISAQRFNQPVFYSLSAYP